MPNIEENNNLTHHKKHIIGGNIKAAEKSPFVHGNCTETRKKNTKDRGKST